MDHEQPGSPVPRPAGKEGVLRSLIAMLRPGQSRVRDSQEMLAEYEAALRRLFPDGAPSGDGTAQYDRLAEIYREDLEWHLAFRRRVLLIGLGGAIVSLAFVTAFFLERFTV